MTIKCSTLEKNKIIVLTNGSVLQLAALDIIKPKLSMFLFFFTHQIKN